MTVADAPSSHARLLAALAYMGGLLSGLVVLGMERQDAFVRFHAMQSVVTFACVLVAHLALRGLGLVGLVASVPFVAAVAVLWIYLIVQAWLGQRQHLPYVGAFADHLLK
jgi:uncharacterized membrane protein